VSVAYDPEQWHDLFVAVAGASAALLGLLFVAVSINLERILAYKGLPERALETLLLLLTVLVISVVGLIPAQSNVALGLELLVVSGLATAVVFRLPSRRTDSAGDEPMQWRISRLGLRLMGTVPLVIGALSVLVEAGGGLYWIAAGIVLAICGAVANAWVLLVEILR
jgi:modulator of FtsH protease